MEYDILKSVILDVSSFINRGLSFDDIMAILDDEIDINKNIILITQITGLFSFEIKTLYEKDEDIHNYMKALIKKINKTIQEGEKNEYF